MACRGAKFELLVYTRRAAHLTLYKAGAVEDPPFSFALYHPMQSLRSRRDKDRKVREIQERKAAGCRQFLSGVRWRSRRRRRSLAMHGREPAPCGFHAVARQFDGMEIGPRYSTDAAARLVIAHPGCTTIRRALDMGSELSGSFDRTAIPPICSRNC